MIYIYKHSISKTTGINTTKYIAKPIEDGFELLQDNDKLTIKFCLPNKEINIVRQLGNSFYLYDFNEDINFSFIEKVREQILNEIQSHHKLLKYYKKCIKEYNQQLKWINKYKKR